MATVRYLVDDIDMVLPFYLGLGFEVAARWGPPFAMLQRGDLTLWLSAPGTSATKPLADGTIPAPGGGWGRIVLSVETIEAVLASEPQLRDAVVSPPVKGPGGTHALLRDLSGNLVELFEG